MTGYTLQQTDSKRQRPSTTRVTIPCSKYSVAQHVSETESSLCGWLTTPCNNPTPGDRYRPPQSTHDNTTARENTYASATGLETRLEALFLLEYSRIGGLKGEHAGGGHIYKYTSLNVSCCCRNVIHAATEHPCHTFTVSNETPTTREDSLPSRQCCRTRPCSKN